MTQDRQPRGLYNEQGSFDRHLPPTNTPRGSEFHAEFEHWGLTLNAYARMEQSSLMTPLFV